MANDPYDWANALARGLNAPSPLWGRVQITQEQIEDSRNNQGAFTQAVQREWEATRIDWTRALERYMQQSSGMYNFMKRPIDPDLELDEGL